MISRSRAISSETPSRMRNGRWRCRYRWFDEYGKRKSASAYGDTAAAARNQAQLVGNIELARVEAIQRGCDPGPLFMPTFAEVAADALVSTIPTRQKARQQRTTRIYLDKWWLPAIGDKAIDAITPGDLNRVIANARQHVADATCNRILCAAAVVFRHAELERLIEHVPTTKATRIREGKKIPDIYSAAELAGVLWVIEPRWALYVALMGLAGLRAKEAREVRAHDVQLRNGILVVRGGPGGTKSRHHREVPIVSSVLAGLLEEAMDTRRKTLVRGVDPRKALDRANAALGIHKHVTPHGLRHTFASLAHVGGRVQPGASARTIQMWLGHSTLEQTNTYTHPARPTVEADLLFDRLDEALGHRLRGYG